MKKTALFCALLSLGACATTEQQVQMSNGQSYQMYNINSSIEAKGAYKIGNPYEINGVWYYPKEDYSYVAEGIASWYGPDFHNGITANGEVYDMHGLTAAHPTLPLPTMVRVTNKENGRSLIVRVNDRGPFVNDRIIDVSKRASQLLGFSEQGTAAVKVEVLAEQSKALKEELRQKGLVSSWGGDNKNIDSAQNQGKKLEVTDIKTQTLVTPALVMAKDFYVQVGVYGEYANAKKVKNQFNALAPVEIYQITRNNKPLYRVRLGAFSSLSEAQNALNQVKLKKYYDAHIVELDKVPVKKNSSITNSSAIQKTISTKHSIGQRFEESMQ